MATNTIVIFYTNSILARSILKKSLETTVENCAKSNSDLIIVSHYPLTDHPQETSISAKKGSGPLSQFAVKDLVVDTKDINCKEYVVGSLVPSYESIFSQLLLGCEKAETKNIILAEHDCLYPEDYLSTAICLDDKLSPNHDILEFQHELNSTNTMFRNISSMKKIAGHNTYGAVHPYWGHHSDYKDMIMEIKDIPRNAEVYKKAATEGLIAAVKNSSKN